jgi:hypothetical protein
MILYILNDIIEQLTLLFNNNVNCIAGSNKTKIILKFIVIIHYVLNIILILLKIK